MTWFLRATALVVLLGFSLPLLAEDVKKPDVVKADDKKADPKKADDPKKTDDPKKDDEKEKKDKLLPAGTLQGKITKYDADKLTMTVEVTFYYQKPNPGEYQGMIDAQNRYYQALSKRPADFNGARQAINDYNTHQAKLYSMEKKMQNLDLQIMDDAKIRVAVPAVAFDDDGKQKKYTRKELDEMKGPDKKLPGYTADIGQIATGVQVQLSLVKKKDAKPVRPVTPPPGGGIGNPKPKDVVGEDVLSDHLPLVSVVVILPQVESR